MAWSPEPLALLSASVRPLTGRLDYLDHHAVAALIYGADKHVINVFTWPTDYGIDGAGRSATSRQGFHVVHWTQGGMTWWAVSDASEDRLRKLARLLGAP